MPSKRMSHFIIKRKKDRIHKEIYQDIKNGKFDKMRYANVSKETFIEFCRQCADVPMRVCITKKVIKSYCGLLDLYETFEKLVDTNPQMAMDPQLGPIKYLFEHRILR